jgi:transcriptional regulator with XRE-family HTH domain
MNKTTQAFKKLFEEGRKRLSYFVQGAIIEFTEAVVTRMEELGVSKSNLAEKLKCKPSYVTKFLRGGTNFTLESMVKIALALDSEISIRLRPKLSAERWQEVHPMKMEIPVAQPRGSTPLLDWGRKNMTEVKLGKGLKIKPADKSANELALTA